MTLDRADKVARVDIAEELLGFRKGRSTSRHGQKPAPHDLRHAVGTL